MPPLPESQLEMGLAALYEEMQSNLTMFVYDVQDDTCMHEFLDENAGYALERLFFTRIKSWTNTVADPARATAFFIPTFTSCWCLRNQCVDEHRTAAGKEAAERVKFVVEDLKERFHYFEPMNGKRHLWMSSHDMGKAEAASFASVMLAEHASCMVNTADPSPQNWMLAYLPNGSVERVPGSAPYAFNPRLDISLPCNGDEERAATALQRIPISDWSRNRTYNAFFAGVESSDVRKDTVSGFASENKSQAAFIRSDGSISSLGQDLLTSITGSFLESSHGQPNKFVTGHLEESDYLNFLSDSDFCLAPRGTRVWSPRLFDAFWFGCIPVIVADDYHLPHSCVLDWSEMSVHVPEAQADQTAEILKAKTQTWKSEARKKLLRLRNTTMWHETTAEPDAFSYAMMEFSVKQFYVQEDSVNTISSQ